HRGAESDSRREIVACSAAPSDTDRRKHGESDQRSRGRVRSCLGRIPLMEQRRGGEAGSEQCADPIEESPCEEIRDRHEQDRERGDDRAQADDVTRSGSDVLGKRAKLGIRGGWNGRRESRYELRIETETR